MGDHDVTIAEQLASATDADACFCCACGQPDEPDLHDPARCIGSGGVNDVFTVQDALAVFDQSCSEEPDLDDHARALHCALVAARAPFAAMREFVDRVDRGEVRSKRTYAKFTELLTTPGAP